MPAAERYFPPIDFKTRFPALDGIRALAVTLVFIYHFGGGSHGGAVLRFIDFVRQRGWVGVDLFFVLSGFLITGILHDTNSDSHYFKRFFARRSLRIFPIFYLVVAVVLLLTPIFQYQWHWLQLTFLVYMGNFFGNWFYYANPNFELYEVVSATHPAATVAIGHFWSLCVEEQFYLLWPIAVYFIRDRVRLLWTATGIAVLALALRLAMLAHFSIELSEIWIVRTLPFRMDSLLIGAILALVLRGPNADAWQRSAKWFFLAGAAAVLTIITLSPRYDSPWLLSIGLTLNALAAAGLICSTLRPGSPAFRFFYLKPLRILGKYSYGFYIYHMLFRDAWLYLVVVVGARLHSNVLGGVVEFIAASIVTFLVSKLSYDVFEVKFLRYKRHFEYDSEIVEHKHAFTVK